MGNAADILGIRQHNIDRRLALQYHIADHRFKRRIFRKDDTDTFLSVHQAVVLITALIDQLFARLCLRMGKDLFHRPGFRQSTLIDDRHMGTDLLYHRHLMGDDDYRDPESLVDIFQ